MHSQYKKFDQELLNNDFLKKHYECLPYIGEEYENSRLLLVGESHYVPKEDVKYVDIEDFYDASFDKLEEGEYKRWINTRNVFEHRVYYKQDFKAFFSNPATEIAKIINNTDSVSKDQKIAAIHQYAFMNYFKRPSYAEGKTIKELTETDYQYAFNISNIIIDILKPKMIIFLSKKAYWAFCNSDQDNNIRSKYIIKAVSHPSRSWWYRKRKDGKNAKEDFYEYVSEIL